MNTDSPPTSSTAEITTDVPTQTDNVETTTTSEGNDVSEITTDVPTQTDNVETTTTPSEEKEVSNEEEEEEDNYEEEERDTIFVVTINGNVAGFTKDETSAQNSMKILANILSGRHISNYRSQNVTESDRIRVYAEYKFFLFSYQSLLFDITYSEIPNLTFSN
jgi:hypothetical protein